MTKAASKIAKTAEKKQVDIQTFDIDEPFFRIALNSHTKVFRKEKLHYMSGPKKKEEW